MGHTLPLAPSLANTSSRQCSPSCAVSPYLPPCLRWQRRHSCPVHWWGCGVGIRAAWAPPSLALEKHRKESSVEPQEAAVLTILLPGGSARLSSCHAHLLSGHSPIHFLPSISSANPRLHQEGCTAMAVLHHSLLSRDFVSVNLIHRCHVLEGGWGYVFWALVSPTASSTAGLNECVRDHWT